MPVIGKAKAVAHVGRFKFGGFFAWLMWSGIHIASLIGFRKSVQVLLSWFWGWLFNSRDARLIIGDARLDIHTLRPPDFVRDATAAEEDGASPPSRNPIHK